MQPYAYSRPTHTGDRKSDPVERQKSLNSTDLLNHNNVGFLNFKQIKVLRYLKILFLYFYYFISFMIVILSSSEEDDYFAVLVFLSPACHPPMNPR